MDLSHLSELERRSLDLFAERVRFLLKDNFVSMRMFGSRARGGGTEESDIDVLVLLKNTDARIKNSVWDIAHDIFLDAWINISPLVMTEAAFKGLSDRERLIAKNIEKDGIPL